MVHETRKAEPVLALYCSHGSDLGLWGKPQLIEQKCSTCHPASLVYEKKRPVQEWDRILFGMKIRDLKVTVEEEKAIREILSERYSEK